MRLFSQLVAAVCLTVAPCVHGQNMPRLGYVYPAGGRQGSSFQIVVGGQFLESVTNVSFSGAGIQARVVEFNKPMTQKEFTLLKDKLKELQDRKAAAVRNGRKRAGSAGTQTATNRWTEADERKIADLKTKLAKNPPNRQANPALAENVVLQVTMAPNTEPGIRELRLATPVGLSNPLVFCVGQLPEFSERAAHFSPPRAPGREPPRSPASTELAITLPATVNGQIMPGGVAQYRFQARRGQKLVMAAAARELIPYLPDAVPGWFQAALSLSDAKGRELGFADHYLFHPDPVLLHEIPVDGEYVVTIRDCLYRGREDFVYRITLGELPFVTSIFPLGGPAGAQTTVELRGWNLPTARLIEDAKDKAPGVYPLSVRKDGRVSNPVPFAVDTLPEALEKEPNNELGSAQPVTLPVVVNGRIDRPGDWDLFRFEGQAGSEVVVEVEARRLNSPLDSVLKLTDGAGKQLAFNDDYEDKGSGLDTHHADSWLHALLPADGTYLLRLGDAQHQGGPEYGYRLRLSAPRPDFALRVVPSSINARPGASVPITVYALRKDGFTNEIVLGLKDAPRGFSLSGGRVPAHQDQVRLTLTVPTTPLPEPLDLSLEGRALIQGRETSRPAVPTDDMMQAFAYHHLVPAQHLKVAVLGRWMPRASAQLVGQNPVRIPAGGTALVGLKTLTRLFPKQVQWELNDPPEGISILDVSDGPEGADLVLHCDAAKSKPGSSGNLIVQVFADPSPAAPGKNKGPANRRRPPLSTLPAIPFEVVNDP
jgi:hypothetical protein